MLFWAFIPIALILSSVALVAAIQYRKVGPNEVLIVSGRPSVFVDRLTGEEIERGFTVIQGGGTLVMPLRERVDVMRVELMTLEKLPAVAEAVAAPLRSIDRIVMVGDGMSKLTGGVVDIMAQLPALVEATTGVDLRAVADRAVRPDPAPSGSHHGRGANGATSTSALDQGPVASISSTAEAGSKHVATSPSEPSAMG